MRQFTTALLAVLLANTAFSAAWRTDGMGYYPDAKPALKWSADESVVWKTKLPSWSNASPVLEGDKIFVCSEPSTLICISSKDGSIIWQAEIPYTSFLSKEEQQKAEALAPRVKELEAEVKKLGQELKDFRKIKDEAERKTKEDPVRTKLDEAKKQLGEAKKYSPPPTHNANGYSTPTPACDGKNVVAVFGSGIAACYGVDGTRKWAKIVGRPTHN